MINPNLSSQTMHRRYCKDKCLNQASISKKNSDRPNHNKNAHLKKRIINVYSCNIDSNKVDNTYIHTTFIDIRDDLLDDKWDNNE